MLLYMWAIILEVLPLPEEPVTAILSSGNSSFVNNFLSILRAISPGKELPLLRILPATIAAFPKIIANDFMLSPQITHILYS